MNSIQRISKYLRIISMILFGLALFLPTHCTNVQCSGFGGGFEALVMGWMLALFQFGGAVAWLANPFYFVALFTVRKDPEVALGFSIAAILIARSFLDGGELLLNEAGHTAYITEIGIGYWFWLGSMVILLVTSGVNLVAKIKAKRMNKQKL